MYLKDQSKGKHGLQGKISNNRDKAMLVIYGRMRERCKRERNQGILMRAIISILFWGIVMTANAASHAMDLNANAFEPLRIFLTNEKIPENEWPVLIEITEKELPAQQQVLTQPLLTKALADHHEATPNIAKPLQVEDDVKHHRYYRAINMIVNNKVVELGLIIVNTGALPDEFNKQLREANKPFGTMIIEHDIKTLSPTKRFFKTNCDQHIARYLKCEQGKLLYGRTNTIVRESDHEWLAHVVELLNGNEK
jgi:hypothetical protein